MTRPRVALFEDSGTERLLLAIQFPWIDFVLIGSDNVTEVMSCTAAMIDWGCSFHMEKVRDKMIQICQHCGIDWCFFSGAIEYAEREYKDALIFNKLGGRDAMSKWLTSICKKPKGARHAISSMLVPIANAIGFHSLAGH